MCICVSDFYMKIIINNNTLNTMIQRLCELTKYNIFKHTSNTFQVKTASFREQGIEKYANSQTTICTQTTM